MSLDKLDAARKHYEGIAAEAEVTIDTYLNFSVGIGEHPNVMEELRAQIEKLGEARDAIDTIITLQNRDKANDLNVKKQLNG
jgi:hypothetical protein